MADFFSLSIFLKIENSPPIENSTCQKVKSSIQKFFAFDHFFGPKQIF